MPNQGKPYLCGGVFLTQLMQARKLRAGVRERYAGDSDGLSDPKTMLAFIRVMSPDFTAPAGGTFKENTSSYKNCRKNHGTYLPFGADSAETRSFDECVRRNYHAVLSRMISFTDSFLDVGTSAKKDERLTKALVEIIRGDEDIPATTVFYINEDGSPATKAQLITATTVCFQAFLVGVWHYILLKRPDNLLGRSTIEDWEPTYTYIHIARVYSAATSNTGNKAAEPKPSEENATPTIESEIVDEVPSSDEESCYGQSGQAPKATKQFIMNNYGKGVQIEDLHGTLTININ